MLIQGSYERGTNMTKERISAKDISDTNDKHYDLGLRIEVMDETIRRFLEEFDLDSVVASLIKNLKNYGKTVQNQDYKLLYLNLSQLIDKNY